MANVRAKVFLNTRVSIINDTSGPKEGKQRHQQHRCTTRIISKSEWDWRFAAACAILCSGSTDYTSYGDAIGHGWV